MMKSVLKSTSKSLFKPLQPLSVGLCSFSTLTNRLNDIRKQINVEPSDISMVKAPKFSLALVDTFFGLEVNYYI